MGRTQRVYSTLDRVELYFGDYTPGRVAWITRDPRLVTPRDWPGHRGLCEIARSKGGTPTLVAVCERAAAIVAEENGPKAVSTRDLTDLLAQVFNAAEADGLITNPSLRSQWK